MVVIIIDSMDKTKVAWPQFSLPRWPHDLGDLVWSCITGQGVTGGKDEESWCATESRCSRQSWCILQPCNCLIRQGANTIELRLKVPAQGTLVKVEVSWGYSKLHKPGTHGCKSRQRGHACAQVWHLHHCSCSRLTLSCLVISSPCQS